MHPSTTEIGSIFKKEKKKKLLETRIKLATAPKWLQNQGQWGGV